MLVSFIDFLRNHLKGLVILCILCLIGVMVWDFFFVDKDPHHAHTWVEQHIPVFWSLFGFGACILLIFFSKGFGNLGIMKREDYYDE